MSNEEVKRDGRMVRVYVGAAFKEKTYSTSAGAKRAYMELMFSKAARQRFMGSTRRDK